METVIENIVSINGDFSFEFKPFRIPGFVKLDKKQSTEQSF
jgi:hypothetical protein